MAESTITTNDEPSDEQKDLDANIAAFFAHTLTEPAPADDANAQEPPKKEEPAPAPAAAPGEPAPASPPAPANADPAAATGAVDGQPDPAKPGTPAPAAAPGIDPADLAAMIGLADAPKPASAPASGEGKSGQPASGTTSPPSEDEPYTPFQPNFQLKPETISALFESEDTETRHKALVGLLSAFGNTITQVMDMRLKEHYAPRLMNQFTQVNEVRTIQQSIQADFQNTHPDLAPYGPAVRKAFEVVAAKNPAAPYSPELRDQVANLARAALRSSGVQLTPPAAAKPAEPAPVAPRKEVKGTPFEAGGARPGGTGSSADEGPAALVEQLSAFH